MNIGVLLNINNGMALSEERIVGFDSCNSASWAHRLPGRGEDGALRN